MRLILKLFILPLYFMVCFYEISIFLDLSSSSKIVMLDILMFTLLTYSSNIANHIIDKLAPVAE